MDPFSHIVLGRTLAALRLPAARRRGTMVAVVLGALAPDADAVLMPFGWDIYLRAHQSGTHSVPGSLAIAALTALVVRVSVQSSRYPPLVAAAWAGALSHLALDILSGAQVGLGWPLIDRPFSLPLVAMAEPFLIAIFFTGAMALLAARKSPARQRLAAIGTLTVACLFLGLKAVLLIQAMSSLGGRPGRVIDRVVEARWASVTEWFVYERTTEALQQWRVRAGGEPELLLSRPIGGEPPLANSSRALPTVRNFLRVHQLGFAVQLPDPPGGTHVLWSDIRFCWVPQAGAAAAPVLASLTTTGGGTGIACGLWFGGTFDDNGRVITQRVQVGQWSQTRDP